MLKNQIHQQALQLVLQFCKANSLSQSHATILQEYGNKSQTRNLLALFDQGSREQFFKKFYKLSKTWNLNIQQLKQLQFQLHIYFAVYNIHPFLLNQQIMHRQAKIPLENFIKTQGKDYIRKTHLLPLFSLPFISKPREHPDLKHIFTKDWLQKLRSIILRQSNNDIQCQLYKLIQQQGNCKNFQNNLTSNSQEVYTVFMNFIVDSNIKWFSIVKDLIRLSSDLLRTYKTHSDFNSKQLEKELLSYSWFCNPKLIQVINCNNFNIFKKDQDQSKIQQQQTIQFKGLSHQRVHKVLGSNSIEDKIFLLKCLKNRFKELINLKTNYKHFILLLKKYDFICISDYNFQKFQKLIEAPDNVKLLVLSVVQYICADQTGCRWIASSKRLMQSIISLCKCSPNIQVRTKTVLLMDKLSEIKQAQQFFLEQKIIQLVLKYIRQQLLIEFPEKQSLAAILLNLTMLKQGKNQFQRLDAMPLLINEQGRSQDVTYKILINSCIWILIDRKSMLKRALQLRLDQILQEQIMRTQQPHKIIQQIYILSKLRQRHSSTKKRSIEKFKIKKQFDWIFEESSLCSELQQGCSVDHFKPTDKEFQLQRKAVELQFSLTSNLHHQLSHKEESESSEQQERVKQVIRSPQERKYDSKQVLVESRYKSQSCKRRNRLKEINAKIRQQSKIQI